MSFKKILPTEIPGNAVNMIGYDWMLITAGNEEHFNTMTAAWGGLGFLWNEPSATKKSTPPFITCFEPSVAQNSK